LRFIERFNTLRNYTPLKQVSARLLNAMCFNTLRNYTPLKRPVIR